MIEAINLEDEQFYLHTFRPQDINQIPEIATELYEILRDKNRLKYLPNKMLYSHLDAELLLKNALINFHSGRHYFYFIRCKSNGQLTGFIDVISPLMAREFYSLSEYPYFIEFFISKAFAGKRILSNLLPQFLTKLASQNFNSIAAVVDRRNTPAKKVLDRSGFAFSRIFDPFLDMYLFESPTLCLL
jgi:RimJ/RimL family protein N-acetyltransferase